MMFDVPTQTTPAISDTKSSSPHLKPPRKKRRKQDYLSWEAGPYNHVRGEMALWAAVITQAMMDALSHSRNPEIIQHKHEAIRWLTENTRDFVTVCHFAGMNPDYVRKRAKQAIANPVSWRAKAGEGKRYSERKAYRARVKKEKNKAATFPVISTACLPITRIKETLCNI